MSPIVTRIILAAGITATAAVAAAPGKDSPDSQSSAAVISPTDSPASMNVPALRQSHDVQSEFTHTSQGPMASGSAEFSFTADRSPTDGDPPKLPTCPGNSLLAQNPDPPSAFTAYVSEQSPNLRRFENIASVAGPITGVRWFGLDLIYLGNNQWADCTETDPTFAVSFHESSGGIPGAAVCSYTLLAQRIPTGVTYGGFELNEYRVTLPSSCILTNGWLSIQGQGDPDCWFLWMSSPDGDQHSYCQGCVSPSQSDDLAFCLLGTPGGVFGACCNESTGQCADNVEINQCALAGFRFTPNTTCANLDPPCQIVTGACCFPNNTCSIITYTDCNFGGGSWLGPDTTCSQCPVLGACCYGFTFCSLQQQQDCSGEGGFWLGPNTSCDNCPDPPVCGNDSLFTQNPSDTFGFTAGTSEEAANIRRWEDFSGVPGPIESLTWWGVDLKPIPPSSWAECVETDPTFKISFHKDANGMPGDLVCSYELLATRTPLNINYNGTELNRYEVALPSPCVLVKGWISIVGLGDPQCWFLWMSSGNGGFSWCDHCNPSPQGFNLAVCLQGTYGGVFGACCTDSIPSCTDNVEISNCINNDQRFAPNTTCAQLDPPCGVIVGACCYPDVTCAITQQNDCQTAGGNWLGPNSICFYCPCITPCPPGGVAEGEVTCFENYNDTFNGGCIVPKPNFSPITLGQTVCGRSGVFLIDGEVHGDFDWYQVNVNIPAILRWAVRAEFRSRIWIYNGNNGCPGNSLAFAAATECFDYSITATVQPGTYWLIFGPLAFDDAAYCGARYYAKATIESNCLGDVAPPGGDFIVNVNDLLAVINTWGPCKEGGSCPADIAPPGGDGIVNVNDLLAVINNWGNCFE